MNLPPKMIIKADLLIKDYLLGKINENMYEKFLHEICT